MTEPKWISKARRIANAGDRWCWVCLPSVIYHEHTGDDEWLANLEDAAVACFVLFVCEAESASA